MRYRLTVELVEDLHSGSGLGNLWVDALLARDRYGKPVIRASHLKGVLRDNARLRLGRSEDKLNALFGGARNRRGALQLTSLYCKRAKPDTLVWSNASRREGSRVPEKDRLFSREFVAAGTPFESELQLADESLADFLERVIEITDRLGGRRSRGNGLIRLVEFVPIPADSQKALNIPRDATMLRLLLGVREALVLPRTGYPGNLIRSESFIRGRTLWGALGQYAIAFGQDALADLIFDRRIEVGNALPLPLEIKKDTGSLADWQVWPFPLYLYGKKPGGNEADLVWPWWAYPESAEQWFTVDQCFDMLRDHQESEDKPKRPGVHQYLWRRAAGCSFRRYACEPRVQLRNAVPKQPNDDTRLFSNEEIPEETHLLVDIRCPDPQDLPTLANGLKSVLQDKAWLGIGRGARPVEVEDYTFLSPSSPTPPTSDSFRFGLTSDLVARTEDLNFATQLSPKLLTSLVGLDSADLDLSALSVCETEVLRGFNGETGLPAVPQIAIRRGSAIVVSGPDAQPVASKLATCLALGEQTWAGLGRFVLEPDYPPASEEAGRGGEPALEENWRETLLSQVDEFIHKHRRALGNLETRPSKSQWQSFRIRSIVCREPQHWNGLWSDLSEAAEKLGQRGWRTLHGPLKQTAELFVDKDQRQVFVDRLVRRILREFYQAGDQE